MLLTPEQLKQLGSIKENINNMSVFVQSEIHKPDATIMNRYQKSLRKTSNGFQQITIDLLSLVKDIIDTPLEIYIAQEKDSEAPK